MDDIVAEHNDIGGLTMQCYQRNTMAGCDDVRLDNVMLLVTMETIDIVIGVMYKKHLSNHRHYIYTLHHIGSLDII